MLIVIVCLCVCRGKWWAGAKSFSPESQHVVLHWGLFCHAFDPPPTTLPAPKPARAVSLPVGEGPAGRLARAQAARCAYADQYRTAQADAAARAALLTEAIARENEYRRARLPASSACFGTLKLVFLFLCGAQCGRVVSLNLGIGS